MKQKLKNAPASALNIAAVILAALIIALDSSGVVPQLLKQFGFLEGPLGIILLAVWGAIAHEAIKRQTSSNG